jgi:hypothetical protein
LAVAKKAAKKRRADASRPRVADRQNYEVHYEAKKTGKAAAAVKKAVLNTAEQPIGTAFVIRVI